jgi:peroxidase
MSRPSLLVVLAVVAAAVCGLAPQPGAAELKENYYSSTCPNVEAIVRGVVQQKMQQTIRTIGSTIRLFFHDCFVEVQRIQIISSIPSACSNFERNCRVLDRAHYVS